MKHFSKLLAMAIALVSAVPQLASAQTKLTLPSAPSGDAAASTTQKVTAAKASESSPKFFNGALTSAADRLAYADFIASGKKQSSLSPRRSPDAPEDSTLYHYTGFNSYAGVDNQGNGVGGWVNFNLWNTYPQYGAPSDPAFKCDTVKTAPLGSPYSVKIGDKIYSFVPNYANGSYSTYGTITKTVFDANTLEILSSQTYNTTHDGDQAYVPYMLTYDDQTGMVYAISMGETIKGDDGFGYEQPYYLNVVDTATCELKRLGKLGSWWTDDRDSYFVPKGITANYGTIYVHYNGNDGSYVGSVDLQNFKVKKIGKLNGVRDGYGINPMVYDTHAYKLLLNHYDLSNGTAYYYVDTYSPYGSSVDTVKVQRILNAPTGFTFFYERPATQTSSYTHKFQPITDFTVTVPEGSNTATISFTTPDSVYADGTPMQFEYYNYKTIQMYLTSSNHKDNFYINSPFPRNLEYNKHYEATVDLPDGMNIVTARFSSSDYNLGLEPIVTSQTVVAGYDAPATPTDARLTINGTKATITWTAPTKGQLDDFGATFDANDITYKVVRSDGYVVDSGFTATTITDNLPEEIKSWTYNVYAISHGNISDPIETNRVAGGTYMALPYEEDFSTTDCLDAWTVINANNDGSYNTWRANQYSGSVNTPWGRGGDDWLITPSFRLKADSLYRVSFQVMGQGNLRVTYGQGNTADAQTNVLAELTETKDVTPNDSYNTVYRETETKDYYFTPDADGNYNIAFYDYSAPQENNHWSIDTFKVAAVASIDAPDSVSNLTFIPDANGALSGTLNFSLPSTTIVGDALSSIDGVNVYDVKGNRIAQTTSGTPGNVASVSVPAVNDYNYYYVVPVNAAGEGRPQVIRQFVGPDLPQDVQNIKLTWSEENDSAITLSFDAVPTVGFRGGYVDPSNVKYNIYTYNRSIYPPRNKVATTDSNEPIDVQISGGLNGKQDQIVLTVTAQNDLGESHYRNAGIVLGIPYQLPFVEPFAQAGLNYSPWILRPGENGQNWTVDQGVFDTNVQPQNNDGVDLVLAPQGANGGSASFETPIIDFHNVSHPLMTMYLYHGPSVSKDAYVTIDGIVNGSDIIPVADTVRVSGNNGWQLHVFDLSSLVGKKAQVVMTGYAPTPADRIWSDNWNIAEASGKDIAVTGISETRHAVVGDKLGIDVTVANLGLEPATDYSVLFNVNDETIAETPSEAALPSGKEATFHFELPVTAANAKDLMYNATVQMDGDEVEDNNTSSDVDVDAKQVDLNAPTNLAINGNEATWTAPEAYNGYPVFEDFEDVDAFQTNNFAGWTSINGDGHLSTSFVQYYGNWWPYTNAPVAWMTWSTTEAGAGVVSGSSVWGAYAGDKCIIDWGNYGADSQGRSNAGEPEDDWLISPEIAGGSDFSFEFKSNDVATVDILTSSTGNEPADFTNTVKTITTATTSDWALQSVTLPADAKYVALHVTQNGFGILVDNITYTKAQGPKLLGYNVYKDNEQTQFVTDTKATISGRGNYAVSAVYDLGESALTNIATGINEINANSQSEAVYYDLDGRLLPAKPVQRGVYIIKQNGKTRKAIIK